MAKAAVIRKSAATATHGHSPDECREIVREEKIFIYSSTQVPGHISPGKWMVVPPFKPVSRGQTVVWRVLDKDADLKLELPADTFEPAALEGNPAAATVKLDAPSGMHVYDAYVNGQLAVGGSSPGVIVDP